MGSDGNARIDRYMNKDLVFFYGGKDTEAGTHLREDEDGDVEREAES